MEDEQDELASSVALAGETITIDSLLERCHSLLDEIQRFQEYLVQHRKDKEVDVRHFQNAIVSEQKSLDKVYISTFAQNGLMIR